MASYTPTLEATTLQVYIATFEEPEGPPVEVQAVTPLTPVIDQEANPAPLVGVVPPEGAVTVAVNDIVEPRVALPWFPVTTTVGAIFDTLVVLELFVRATL